MRSRRWPVSWIPPNLALSKETGNPIATDDVRVNEKRRLSVGSGRYLLRDVREGAAVAVVVGQVAEADGVRVEGQLDDADGAVTLLADDHLGLTLQPVHVLLPLQVLLRALARFGAAQI